MQSVLPQAVPENPNLKVLEQQRKSKELQKHPSIIWSRVPLLVPALPHFRMSPMLVSMKPALPPAPSEDAWVEFQWSSTSPCRPLRYRVDKAQTKWIPTCGPDTH
jgi:hypothetical protein